MKKILTVLLIAFLFAGAFSIQSCRKCSTCTYTYEVVGQPVATYTYPELCGNSNDINNYEEACAQAAAAYGNTCNCN
ncbi:MAG TPA: hypothetical protein VIN10_11930 [Bacteroidales bacterium]